MTFVPEVSTINQKMQIAAESTIGTAVAANKLLECFDWIPAINGDVDQYGATGHKYDLEQQENTEWVDITASGPMDFNGMVYLLSGVMGAVSPAAYNSSATAKGWTYSPPTTGSIAPTTYSMEQGDSTRARKWAYTLFNSFGYTVTRKEAKLTAKAIAQPLTDGITLTTSPTAVALAPVSGKHFNVYLDSTSGGLGTTQLLKFLAVDYMFDGVYGPFWPLNRANLGFTSHVDLKPKTTVKLKMEADSVGMGLLANLQVGSTQFLRVQAQGTQIASDGGGSSPVYNLFQHDMAIKIGKPQPFSDEAGIYAIEWNCPIVEDPTWTHAQQALVVNLLTSL